MRRLIGKWPGQSELESIGFTTDDVSRFNASNPGGWNLARVPRRGWRLFRINTDPAMPTTETCWLGLGALEDILAGECPTSPFDRRAV